MIRFCTVYSVSNTAIFIFFNNSVNNNNNSFRRKNLLEKSWENVTSAFSNSQNCPLDLQAVHSHNTLENPKSHSLFVFTSLSIDRGFDGIWAPTRRPVLKRSPWDFTRNDILIAWSHIAGWQWQPMIEGLNSKWPSHPTCKLISHSPLIFKQHPPKLVGT